MTQLSKEPRPSGRGFLEEVQLFSPSLLRLMKPNVLLDDIGCHFVTHRPNNIPIFPKLSAPQLLPDLRKLLPNLLGADRLQQPHSRADRVLRRKTEKQMDMILVLIQFLNLKSVMPRNLAKQLPDPLPNRALQHPFPILGRLHQMIAGVVHTVREEIGVRNHLQAGALIFRL